MTRGGRQYENACEKFLQSTDINLEELPTEELYELYYTLAHRVKGVIEDRLGNLALILQDRRGEEE